MANTILVQEVNDTLTPPQIIFRDSTDFSPAAATDLRTDAGTPTYTLVQLDMTSVANNAARQSAKFDFGENRAEKYGFSATVELAATPTAGAVIEFYLNPSHNSTAASSNKGGCSGSDAAYTGVDSDIANSVSQLQFIGVHVCTNDPTPVIQSSVPGVVFPTARYGSLVVVDKSGAAFHSDAVETHFALTPIVSEVQ